MAVEEASSKSENDERLKGQTVNPAAPGKPNTTAGDGDDGDDEEEEEEPRLKYATLTKNLGPLYRNGDASSTFLVAGDKMAIGTHNGHIHVLLLPSLQSLKVYHAHTASVSAISISPYPPPLPPVRLDGAQRSAREFVQEKDRSPAGSFPAKSSTRQQAPVLNIPSNQIYIATSSIDGNVCIASLIDPKDVQLRNFGRPIQTVALSPEYKSDRNFLSGGQAGSLILTTGGQAGKSTNATTNGRAGVTASGWLGTLGLSANTGTDKVLHSGEGIISTIKWSLSGKYVLWVNEQGIKIMRSNLRLESGESHLEWKRISHIDRPNRPGWEEMAGVWRARAEWIDRDNLESEEDPATDHPVVPAPANGTTPKSSPTSAHKAKGEEVVVGWGDTVWIVHVYPGSAAAEGDADDGKIGRAEVATIIRFDDCTISGISLYTPSLLLVLAFLERKGSSSTQPGGEGGKKGRRQRHNALEPELRLVDMHTKEEVDTDTLTISRFATLSSSDYHLGILPPVRVPASVAQQRGYLGALGSGAGNVSSSLYSGVETVGLGMWDATMYGPRMLGANRIFSGAESIRSGKSGGPEKTGSVKDRNYLTGWLPGFGTSVSHPTEDLNAVVTMQNMKIFILSPYDCIVAVRRTLSDRLQWHVNSHQYQQAWELVDKHPEAAGTASQSSEASTAPTPSKASSVAQSGSGPSAGPATVHQQPTLAEFFADSESLTSQSRVKDQGRFSAAEKEKRRIGELWLQQLVSANKWTEAAEVAGKVLNTSTRWEHWIWTFIKRQKFDEIAPFVPTLDMTPPLPSTIFEMFLGHYVATDRCRFKELLDLWPSDLFDISSITAAIDDQLQSEDLPKDSADWRILQECLARLFLADGHYDDALRCYIRLQDADAAMSLIKEHHLIDAVADDIPSFVLLRISSTQLKSASREELEELAADPVKLLVDEARHGVVEPDEVVTQLEQSSLPLFLFFYLRALWRGEGMQDAPSGPRVGHSAAAASLAADTGKVLVDQFADTAVELFAEYDRGLLMDFLQLSTAYTFENAVHICERKHYIEELVYLLSKTGEMKKALFLIIDELKDVSKAIAFAKEQDDQGLWDDLLDYSMSRPRFISGLLAEVGTAIDPITLVKRIPSGLEVEGLKDGLRKMIREYDLQDSISAGVAKVLSSEVAVGMEVLLRGRRKGIKFDVTSGTKKMRSREAGSVSEEASPRQGVADEEEKREKKKEDPLPGYCAACDRAFRADEKEILVGFACGHIYHVSHLLYGPDHEEEASPALPKTIGDDGQDASATTFTRTVGPKVTTSRLLKDKIEAVGGCTVCKAERARLEQV